ncbi:MAG: hypothetical protein LE180_06050 [Endomicrobium sp.]|uniref:hypothetical protein n=1 Tax=Candidatus Endomicrobiellum pyrsonymphae TaxID=1408203 RepID=UPI0035779BDD|nr:hypothetical protein [Endomicrobium sp.]
MRYVRKDFGNVFKQRCFNKYNGITNVSIEIDQCPSKRVGNANGIDEISRMAGKA